MTAQSKIKLALIFGGRSGEHDVSLMSAKSVLGALDANKYEVVQIGITREGKWLTGPNALEALTQRSTDGLMQVTLLADPADAHLYAVSAMEQGVNFEQVSELDVIFPVLHGTFGEDGTMQGLLEMADVAYVGAGVTGSAVAMDKGIFKDVMRAHSIPVLEAVTVLRSELSENIDSLLDKLETIAPYPLFTKPANLGSSVGVTKCQTRSDLYEGLLDAAQYDRRILVERGLNNAREIEVSVLGNDDPISSIAGEIVPGEDFYSYTAKYHDDNSQLLIPAALNETQMAQVRVDAVRAYKAIDCGGMARVDFLMDPETGSLYLNEINTIPGFTSISMYPKLWEATGIPYSKLLDKLVHFALERKRDRDQTTRTFARAG